MTRRLDYPGNDCVRRRGGQPTDMGVLVARIASARALRPNASIRSLAAQAHVGRQAVRRAIVLLDEADRWAYESQGGLRDDQSSRAKADDSVAAAGSFVLGVVWTETTEAPATRKRPGA